MNNINYNSNLHPSIFQNGFPQEGENGDIRTLMMIRKERTQRLTGPGPDIDKLVSPGKFNLTNNDNKITGSNTLHLFKNLHGETLLTFLFFSEKNV